MPSSSEYNQLRRLIGDYNTNTVTTTEMDKLLNEACLELTGDFATPIVVFDTLVNQYRFEIILRAAINFWWNKLGDYADHKHSMTAGSMTANVSEKWDRIWQMIQNLEQQYSEIQLLRIDITIGNYSRYSKQTLRRIGGIREENT